jgi:hypothetical protein
MLGIVLSFALVSCADDPFTPNGQKAVSKGNLEITLSDSGVPLGKTTIGIGASQVVSAVIRLTGPTGVIQTATWTVGGSSTFLFNADLTGAYTLGLTQTDTSNFTASTNVPCSFVAGYNYYITITLGGNVFVNVGTNGIVIPPTTNTNTTNTNVPPTGTTFGLYSETVPVDVVWDTDGVMDVWNAGFDVMDDTTTHGDGTTSMKLTCLSSASTPAWAGLGLRTEPLNTFKNLSAFTGGYLKFMYRSTTMITKIGIKGGTTAATEKWITGAVLKSTYGLRNDNTWSQVTIPLSAFTGLNLTNITQYFMLITDGANHVVGNEYWIDNIYFTK